MKEIAVTSLAELTELLKSFGQDTLYRGQTAHFVKGGTPSVVTSFDRKGCIPSVMAKWCRYSSSVLQTYIGGAADAPDFMQALLQHYGWRSFYVDCSTNAAVAAWFAGHEYSDKPLIDLSEDCDERPVMLIKKRARYEPTNGTGHLYVFDRSVAGQTIGVTDLTALDIEGARPRTKAQDAWLLGPLRNTEVPAQCFVAHITADRAVFREYAAAHELRNISDLFPPVDEDPILDALLGLPWKEEKSGKDIGMPFFRRALELPEYDDSFQKIASPSVAFYRGATIAGRDTIDGASLGGIIIPVPDVVLFGVAAPAPLRFPKINELLAKHRSVAFEIDDLVQHPNMKGMVTYQKGVCVQKHEKGLVEVCELMVDHPGQEITGAGINYGWYYTVDEHGEWTRVRHEKECPCGKDAPHLRHLSALHIAEDFLKSPKEYEIA